MADLGKYLPVNKEEAFRNGVNENFSLVERRLNSGESVMNAHQKTQINAHNTAQILHYLSDKQKEVYYRSELDLKQFLMLESARISNLVLGATTDQSVELKDSRVDLEGVAHTTLYDRLLADFTRFKNAIDKLIEIENGLDLEKFEPMFVGNLATYRNSVMQTFQIDPVTNQYFVTQSDGKKPEGFVLSQTSPNGSKLLSAMKFKNGGHGTTFGLEHEKGKTIIWSFIRNEKNVRKLIRVPYKANSTIADSASLRDYTPKSLKDTYFTPVVDAVNGYMLIRRGDLKCELRSLNDIKNGVDKILYTVTIPDSERNESRASQGSVSHGTILYWYSGVTSTTARVTKYDFKTGKRIGIREFDFPNERGDGFTDGYREPEGLAYYVNPHNGKESLLMGITTGELQKRYNIVYAIHQRGAQEHFDSIRAMGAQNYATIRGDGRAHSTPVGLKKLSDLRAAGEYYMTGGMVDLISDLPSPQFAGSGMFVINKASNQNYSLRQIVTRFSASRKNLTMERSLDYDGTFGVWSVHQSHSDVAESINPSNYKNKLSNVKWPGEYYLTTNSSKAFTDHPEPNVAGWWLRVSSGSTGPAFVQELIKNSKTTARRYQRVVNATSAGPWIRTLNAKN